jgi:putative NADPH-quinone reductase
VNVVVTYAHPCPESYAAAVRDRVLAGLGAAGHDVHLIDLHAAGYDPYRPLPSADQAAVAAAESLVLVHPTWWTSHPAILLAWIGQVAETELVTVRTLVTVTTLGGSRFANRLAGESGARVIDRAVRPRCAGRPPHRRLALYGLDRSTPAQRAVFLERVERRIGALVR